MAKITYISHDGNASTFDAADGDTVMDIAVRNSVKGIDADCGGACACATCHVYVDPDWTDRVGGPSSNENEMLDFTNERLPNSRLSCQIIMNGDLDGLVIRMPENQG